MNTFLILPISTHFCGNSLSQLLGEYSFWELRPFGLFGRHRVEWLHLKRRADADALRFMQPPHKNKRACTSSLLTVCHGACKMPSQTMLIV